MELGERREQKDHRLLPQPQLCEAGWAWRLRDGLTLTSGVDFFIWTFYY